MIGSDTLQTVFQISGLPALLGAMNQAQNAALRLISAEVALEKIEKRHGDTSVALANLGIAKNNAAIATFNSSMMMAQRAFSVTRTIVGEVQKAIESYTQYAKTVREVQQLTGGSTREAAFAVNLSRAAGLKDTEDVREIMRLAKDLGSQSGQGALARLGISGTSGRDGVQLLNTVIGRLREMPDGIRKSALEMQIFGARAVRTALALEYLTDAQREEALDLAQGFQGNIRAAQEYEASINLLGMSFEQRLVFPLVQMLLPALTQVVAFLGGVVKGLAAVNDATGGFAGFIVLAGVGVVTVGLLAFGAFTAATAFWKMAVAIDAAAVALNVLKMASGPIGWILLILGLLGSAISLRAPDAAGSNANSAMDANTQATMDNTAAMQTMSDNFHNLRGLFPSGASSAIDLSNFADRMAFGAVG